MNFITLLSHQGVKTIIEKSYNQYNFSILLGKRMVPPAGIEPAAPGLGTLKRQFLQSGYWQWFQRNTLISKKKKRFYIFRLLPPNLHKTQKTTTILLQ